ncbi:MAG: response regulator [Nitrospinota bacterium]
MKILVVDDVQDNVEIVCEILEGKYECVKAFSGAEAVRLAKEKTPNLIVLDVNMPDMNGYEVLENLKADPGTTHIPVIFLTATYRDTDRVVDGLDLGAVDYITKPVDSEILLARIGVAARVKSAEDALKKSQADLEKRVDERTAQLVRANEILQMEIVAREQVEKALLLKEKKVEEQASRLQKYVYTASHFLKVPLTKIQGFSKVLSGEVEKMLREEGRMNSSLDKIREFSDIIKAEVKKAVRLDMYFLEYANASVLEPSASEAVELKGVLADVSACLKKRGEGNGATIVVTGAECYIRFNQKHLNKVFKLLFTYLLSTVPKDTQIIASFSESGDRIECFLEGRVFTPEVDVAGLFDFLPEMNGTGKGLGTDLAIVKVYVELYGGSVAYQRKQEGEGRFVLSLPKAEAEKAGPKST